MLENIEESPMFTGERLNIISNNENERSRSLVRLLEKLINSENKADSASTRAQRPSNLSSQRAAGNAYKCLVNVINCYGWRK